MLPTAELARFKRQITQGVETLTWFWVVGVRGAVSTWFSDTRRILGHSICSGGQWHSPRPLPPAEHHGGCEFLERDCWTWGWSAFPIIDAVQAAFDRGDDEVIYRWLGAEYAALVDGDSAGPR